ncbi:hypothetical protein KDA_25300 [Dictyobacter alpinus]|uniref:Uncharacterized protein n=1 Tax=Dictyobacter alpinus TaxID=2014873 RepID=A0A402B6S4_9CHLR|nr:hypothetical protein [Dictyobacter alpinus]GCE27046.1 hypothetical protein KDA_25300 [Dictyobacter alpinus]
MSLPFTEQQCFFVAILVFVVVGFQRGWRRELVSLVFILLASFLVHQDTSNAVGSFINRLPAVIGYAAGASQQPQTSLATGFLGGPFWSLIIFAALVALGYYVGNKAFPRPFTPQERFIGIVPAVIAGAFVLGYLSNYFRTTAGRSTVSVDVQSPDPLNYVAIIFLIAIIAITVAVIASRRKAAKK